MRKSMAWLAMPFLDKSQGMASYILRFATTEVVKYNSFKWMNMTIEQNTCVV